MNSYFVNKHNKIVHYYHSCYRYRIVPKECLSYKLSIDKRFSKQRKIFVEMKKQTSEMIIIYIVCAMTYLKPNTNLPPNEYL